MVELLAPAANLKSGIAAINAGADALYIGGSAFGARQNAGNSMDDIAQLTDYAHRFGAKVYLTMNTILYDNELEAAQKLIRQAWKVGVDALIVQDMALLEMELPPIPLHGSTQTFNLTAERVKFLEQAGFQRVILERGITLDEIREIRRSTTVELEAFVHGAICVGYSGQCYLSQALCSRSGNRGACAQPCRSQWNLIQNDRVISRDQTLLSVGDLNLSDNLEELIAAGITSLKIEGRLKDESYVVNNTAHYDRRLRQLGVARTSSGVSTPSFEPNPTKSFSRSFSTYFLTDRTPSHTLLNTNSGEYLGTVTQVTKDSFIIDSTVVINNGDGITFDGGGTNVNTASGNRIYPNRMEGIEVGTAIYRNLDRSFRPSAVRRIDVAITFGEGTVTARDTDGATAVICYTYTEQAQNTERTADNIRKSFTKSGDTIFRVTDVLVEATPFLPMSELNELRRKLLSELSEARAAAYVREERHTAVSHPPLSGTLDYRANVANSLARQFYEKCGITHIDPAFELERPEGAVLLRTRHCIRREMGMCLRNKGVDTSPMTIENNSTRLSLRFNCQACEMEIIM